MSRGGGQSQVVFGVSQVISVLVFDLDPVFAGLFTFQNLRNDGLVRMLSVVRRNYLVRFLGLSCLRVLSNKD